MTSLLFRRNKQNEALPTTSSSAPSKSTTTLSSPFTIRPVPGVDGSAKSIRLHENESLRDVWKKASTATKATYISLLVFFLLLVSGIQSIRYNRALIHLNCHFADCTLRIVPKGWRKKKRKAFLNFPRRQLVKALAVKTDAAGKVVRENPPLYEDYRTAHGKKKAYKVSNYRGPDEHGQYYSYAIHLLVHTAEAEAEAEGEQQQQQQQQDKNKKQDGPQQQQQQQQPAPLTNLDPLLPYAQSVLDKYKDNDNTPHLRLVFRQLDAFGNIAQSKRRVRLYLQKMTSYIQKRRQTLTVKENAPPPWQGILMIVLGGVGCLLTILIGQFYEASERHAHSGPGVRRRGGSQQGRQGPQRQSQQQRPRQSQSQQRQSTTTTTTRDVMRRTTPSRYEVRTKPAPPTVYKRR